MRKITVLNLCYLSERTTIRGIQVIFEANICNSGHLLASKLVGLLSISWMIYGPIILTDFWYMSHINGAE